MLMQVACRDTRTLAESVVTGQPDEFVGRVMGPFEPTTAYDNPRDAEIRKSR